MKHCEHPETSARTRGARRVAVLGAALVALLPACGSAPVVPDRPAEQPVEANMVCGVGEGHAFEGNLNANTEDFAIGGVPVILKRTPGNPVVSLRLYVDGGSRDLDSDSAGIVGLAMSVAVNGCTTELARADYTARLASMGSLIGGSTSFDYSVMSMDTLHVYLDETYALFRGVLQSPAFPEAEVERQRELAIQGVAMRRENPDDLVVDTARTLLFEGHPYRFDPEGTVDSLSAFTGEQLAAAYAGLFDRSRMLLVVVGDLDRAELEALVGDTFATFAESGAPAPAVPPFVAPETRLAVEDAAIPTNYILGLTPAPAPTDPDYPAMVLAMSHLGDRFFEEVRSNRNLTYAVSANIGARLANYAYFYVTAVDPAATVPVMYDEIRRLQSEPLTAQDLEALVAVFITGYYTGLDSNGAIASELAWWQLYGGGRANADSYIDGLQAVTAADIQRVAQAYLDAFQVGVVGDEERVNVELFQLSGN